jgi:type I restriction enzyme S subunit
MNTPALRFNREDGSVFPEWSEKTIESEVDFLSGFPFDGEDIKEDTAGIRLLRGVNITEGKIRSSLEIDRFYNGDLNKLSKYLLKQYDLVIGMDGSKVGKNSALITKKDSDTLLVQRVARLRAKSNSSIFFLYQNINSNKFHSYVDKVKTSSGIPHISAKQIKEFRVFFPVIEEQTKIANFLTAVDEKIQQINQKHDLLTQYKKGVMQQIFSQELRFKDDDGRDFPDWEEKEVGEVFKVTRGNVLAMPLVSESKTNKHIYPVYSSQTKNNGLSGYYNEYLYENSITWTTDGANAGDVNFRDGKFYCTNVCGVLISKDGHANSCIAAMINAVSRRYVSYVGNPKLMNGVMAKIAIDFPCVKEQIKIADFLTALDDKITATQAQLEAVKQYKQGLLQQMFV